MGRSAKIRHRRRRRQRRPWSPMRLAEFARVLAEIMIDDPTDDTAPFLKWMVVKPL